MMHRLLFVWIIVVYFHLCILLDHYTVLEVLAVRRPMHVCCGSQCGRCVLFINILDSLMAPYLVYNTTSVVMVAGICNSVGGGVLFDIPPRWRWRWPVQYAPCIACQSSVPFPSPHASSQLTRQPPPPLLIIRCSTMFYHATRSSWRSVVRPIAAIAATMASFNSA